VATFLVVGPKKEARDDRATVLPMTTTTTTMTRQTRKEFILPIGVVYSCFFIHVTTTLVNVMQCNVCNVIAGCQPKGSPFRRSVQVLYVTSQWWGLRRAWLFLLRLLHFLVEKKTSLYSNIWHLYLLCPRGVTPAPLGPLRSQEKVKTQKSEDTKKIFRTIIPVERIRQQRTVFEYTLLGCGTPCTVL
jgi:hypothetical protein